MSASDFRKKQLIQLLDENAVMSINELSEILKVSLPTIRRDLEDLEQKGLIKRSWGKASLCKEENTSTIPMASVRADSHWIEKRAIASCARKLIQEGDSIILDSGTTTMALANQLTAGFKNLTVVTNSLLAINALTDNNFSVQCSGGSLERRNMCFVGTEAENFFRSIHVSKAFIGTTSMRIPMGFSTFSPFQGAVKRLMMNAADKVYYLMDSSKINAHAISKVADFDEVDAIITDKPFTEDIEEFLKKHKVNFIYA